MGYKLHRSHRSVFRRKRTWPRVLLSLFAALVVVAGGFFAARWLDRPKTELPTDTSATVSTPATESDVPDVPPLDGDEDPESDVPSDTAAPTDPTETDPPKKKGCGSTVSLGSFTLILLAAFAPGKKRNRL